MTTRRVLSAVALAPVLIAALAACGPSSHPAGAAPTPVTAVATPSACAGSLCTSAGTAELGDGYTATLWRQGADDGSDPALVELQQGGVARQWWAAKDGDSEDSTLTCLAGSHPDCVLISPSGAHGSVAQLVELVGGALVAPAGGLATFDSWPASARDLDGNGVLVVVGVMSDYRPNYAQGHLYWRTEVYRDGRGYVSTGCAPRSSPSAAAPTTPETGSCPTV